MSFDDNYSPPPKSARERTLAELGQYFTNGITEYRGPSATPTIARSDPAPITVISSLAMPWAAGVRWGTDGNFYSEDPARSGKYHGHILAPAPNNAAYGLLDGTVPRAPSLTMSQSNAAAPSPATPQDDARPNKLTLDPGTRDLVVRTVLGAAGADSDDSQAAVAAAIRSRFESGLFGDHVRRVAVDPLRFPLWRSHAGRKRMYGYASDSPEYLRVAANVDRAFGDGSHDRTGGGIDIADPDPEQEEPTFADRFHGFAVRDNAEALSSALRRAADEKLASGDTRGQFKTFVDNAANTALLNLPRNIKAYVRSRDSGRSFSDEYDRLKDMEEAGSRLNPKSAIAGIGAGILALPGVGGATAAVVRAGGAAAARRGAVLGAGYAGLEEALDSKDPIRVALAASLGGALGAVAAPVADKIVSFASQWVKSGRTIRSMVRPDGMLTEEAAAAARASGADPATLATAVRWGLGRK
jgi:hypothetical protein